MTATLPYPMPAKQNLVNAEGIKRDYAELREQASVVPVAFPFGEGDGWMTLTYDLARQMYNDPRFSIEAMLDLDEYPRMRQAEKMATPSFMAYDGEKHQTKRKVLMKHLTVKRVQKLIPDTARLVEEALDDLERSGNPANVSDTFSRILPVRVLCSLLGAPPIEDREFLEASYFVVDSRAQTLEQVMEAYVLIATYFDKLYEEKKRNPGDDLMSAMIHDTEAGEWTEDELRTLGMTLLAAGHDATGSMLNGMLEWLSYEPELFTRLRNEPEALPRATEELLRCVSVGVGIARGRIATEDMELGGVHIKAGDAVGGNFQAAHHDPAAYPNPDVLDIDRVDPKPHMAFGYGPHACVGAQLARMEINLALKAVLGRYKTFTNVEPAEGWRERRLMKGTPQLIVNWERA
ncbi:cytochrome P450 [Microbacterium thalassium]|uniref:Nocardicin N-oxygenase n=1 Tax=Microbacterium thalassium TaxID=362649 RepID=A0A7X0FN04_9MICO|nr:cytochrome P450 [Microbacterium thalassium]MBB6390507.1 nocardicin N-oxygenase [Microbacterium thalassium]GLK25618.1 cytochrome P450 [Microbacterium thalassium]